MLAPGPERGTMGPATAQAHCTFSPPAIPSRSQDRYRSRVLLDQLENLRTEYNDLVRQWSRYIEMVGPRRPLRASDAQIAEVRKRREAGASRGKISTETKLGLRTVRTI